MQIRCGSAAVNKQTCPPVSSYYSSSAVQPVGWSHEMCFSYTLNCAPCRLLEWIKRFDAGFILVLTALEHSHMLLFSQLCSFVLYQAADLVIQLSSTSRIKDAMVTADKMPFGTVFTDHMLTIEWNATEGWQTPHIKPLGNLSLHPACSSLHYGIQAQDLNFKPTSCSLWKGWIRLKSTEVQRARLRKSKCRVLSI